MDALNHNKRAIWLQRGIIAISLVCWAYAYTTRFTGFMGASRVDKLQLLGVSFLFLAVIPFVLLSQALIALIRKIPHGSILRISAVSTLLTLCHVFFLAWKRGVSPLEMVSRKANNVLVDALRNRFGNPENKMDA